MKLTIKKDNTTIKIKISDYELSKLNINATDLINLIQSVCDVVNNEKE